MGDKWRSDETDPDDSDKFEQESGTVFSGEMVWVGEIRLTPYDCPECLRLETFDCDSCTFITPDDCQLLRNLEFRKDAKILFSITRERNSVYIRRQGKLRKAIQLELKAHGRPLHYTILTQMVATRYPKLNASEMTVIRILSNNPSLFQHISTGVYTSRENSDKG